MDDLLGEFVGELFLTYIRYPGAFIYWVLFKRQYTYKQVIKEYRKASLLLSLLLYVGIGCIVYQIIQ